MSDVSDRIKEMAIGFADDLRAADLKEIDKWKALAENLNDSIKLYLLKKSGRSILDNARKKARESGL